MWNMCVVKQDQAFGNRLFQAPFVTVHSCAVFELLLTSSFWKSFSLFCLGTCVMCINYKVFYIAKILIQLSFFKSIYVVRCLLLRTYSHLCSLMLYLDVLNNYLIWREYW